MYSRHTQRFQINELESHVAHKRAIKIITF